MMNDELNDEFLNFHSQFSILNFQFSIFHSQFMKKSVRIHHESRVRMIRNTQTIRVFAPATVANVSCGFDIFGFAVHEPGDEVLLTLRNTPGVKILSIHGDKGLLSVDPEKNTAGVAAQAFLNAYAPDAGVDIELFKGLPIGSGLGSSAASAAAVLFGLNRLLGHPADGKALLEFGLQSEKSACGSAHGDNVIPSLLGGFILIRSYHPLDIRHLPIPEDLYCTLVFPQVEIETRKARKLIPKSIPLETAVRQWGNTAGLAAGFCLSDYDLIARSMEDFIAEPVRATLIPQYPLVTKSAQDAGALGCGISGSGPTVFALSKGKETAQKVREAMRAVYEKSHVTYQTWVSPLNPEGPRIV
jgi:homoserine kinase